MVGRTICPRALTIDLGFPARPEKINDSTRPFNANHCINNAQIFEDRRTNHLGCLALRAFHLPVGARPRG